MNMKYLNLLLKLLLIEIYILFSLAKINFQLMKNKVKQLYCHFASHMRVGWFIIRVNRENNIVETFHFIFLVVSSTITQITIHLIRSSLTTSFHF